VEELSGPPENKQEEYDIAQPVQVRRQQPVPFT
jgi:hypothetical protein